METLTLDAVPRLQAQRRAIDPRSAIRRHRDAYPRGRASRIGASGSQGNLDLEPILDIAGERMALHTGELEAVPAKLVSGPSVADLRSQDGDYVAAANAAASSFRPDFDELLNNGENRCQ